MRLTWEWDWSLTVNDEHNLDSPTINNWEWLFTSSSLVHVISNSDLYQRTNEIPLIVTILKNRWKLCGHILRIHPQTPAQQSMRHCFTLSENGRFRGRQRITLPIILNKDLFRASEHFSFSQRYGIQQFQFLQGLDRLIELVYDWQLWKHLCNDIFEAAQAD